MDLFKFRPVLDGLEEKSVPSVSPADVYMAFHVTSFTTSALEEVAATLGQPRTSTEIQALATYIRQLGDASRVAAPVLAQFQSDLSAQIAAKPSLAVTLGEFVTAAAQAQFEATVNGAYSDVFSVGFGASPRVPPPPPPPPPPGASTSLPGNPVGSTLPFSLGNPAWQTLPSGVRIWDVTPGTGTAVQAGDKITVNYTGYLTNGTVFDSSFSRNQPFSATLSTSNLIAGWVDGIPGMKPGGVRRLDIPASLAYGSAGQGNIPPNAELVFDITLISSP